MSRTTEESREYQRAWRAKNPEKYRAKAQKYRLANVDRCKSMVAAWARANPDKIKNYHVKRTYGLTLEDKAAILAAQGGKCGICGSDDPGTTKGWQIDADHSTVPATPRGILCKNCNTALGNFKHSPELLTKAIGWLGGFENVARIIKR